MSSQTDTHQLLTPGMRGLLWIAAGLVLVVGVPLFLLSSQTATYFAWTINPPLTAAFMGAAYWTACALEALSARERLWARARLAVPAVLAFTTLTLIATLLHLDRFHLAPDLPLITRAGTWVWLAVYISVPPAMAVLLARQLRAPGGEPPRLRRLPAWLRGVTAGQGVVMFLLGAGLFLAPLAVAPLWPWKLSALTGRAIGAWLVGLGIAAAHIAWEDDWARADAGFLCYVVFAVLELIVVVRYAAAVVADTGQAILDWGGPSIWVYLVFLLSLLGVGGYALLARRRLSLDQ